jgi:hypothetical protein
MATSPDNENPETNLPVKPLGNKESAMSIRNVRCVIVRMPANARGHEEPQVERFELRTDRTWHVHGEEDRPRRAKDLLPWADPYIVKLIERCQKEVARDIEEHRKNRETFVHRRELDNDRVEFSLESEPHRVDDEFEYRDPLAPPADFHPYGFQWEGEVVNTAETEEDDFRPNDAYLRPLRKTK